MNNLQILGRLTRDPELRNTQTGKAICHFSIAVNRNKDESDFFECEAWEKTAETISEHLKKGQRILIDGRLQQDRWKDQQSGENRSKVKIIVNRFDFIEAANQNSSPQQQSSSTAPQAGFNTPPQPQMGMPPGGPYGQPPAPYPGQQYGQPQPQYQQHSQAPGYMPPMPSQAQPQPQSQQQGFFLGGGNPPQNPQGTALSATQYGHPAPPHIYDDIPF